MEIVSDSKTLKNVESTTFLFQAFNKKQFVLDSKTKNLPEHKHAIACRTDFCSNRVARHQNHRFRSLLDRLFHSQLMCPNDFWMNHSIILIL